MLLAPLALGRQRASHPSLPANQRSAASFPKSSASSRIASGSSHVNSHTTSTSRDFRVKCEAGFGVAAVERGVVGTALLGRGLVMQATILVVGRRRAPVRTFVLALSQACADREAERAAQALTLGSVTILSGEDGHEIQRSHARDRGRGEG